MSLFKQVFDVLDQTPAIADREEEIILYPHRNNTAQSFVTEQTFLWKNVSPALMLPTLTKAMTLYCSNQPDLCFLRSSK